MKQVFKNINLSRRSMHILFWACWVLSFTFVKSISYSIPVYLDWLIYYVLTLPIFIVHTYIIAYWLIPSYFIKKKYSLFCFFILNLLIIFSILELIISNELIFGTLSSSIQPEINYLGLKNVIISGIGNHYIILLFLSVKVLKKWYETENIKNDLQREIIEEEMKLLQNQLRPRFLLNTIGTLEKMAEEKSEKTPDMIIRISKLLDNISINSTFEQMPVLKELKLIDSYLDIQKIIKYPKLESQVLLSGDLNLWTMPAHTFFPMVEQLIEILGKSNEPKTLKIFARSESNHFYFQSSAYYCMEDQLKSLESIVGKTQKRLSVQYAVKLVQQFDDNRINISFTVANNV